MNLGRLRHFAQQAGKLRGSDDAKLQKLIEVVGDLLGAGHQPIIWCRYIATADYVAEELNRALGKRHREIRIISVTGALAEDERRLKVESLADAPMHVLVATDCLSEGVNLQELFSAVVHYDLPWNPNRLEQREGRVDRFGQPSSVVKAILIFGNDNPVDGAVLEVLLRKAHDIYRELQVHVPVPVDSETIMEAVLHSLFERTIRYDGQMSLFDQDNDAGRLVTRVHSQWESAAHKESESQARFAQRALKPEEIRRALGETDAVLGSPADVQRFLVQCSQRLPFGLRDRGRDRFDLAVADLPPAVRLRLGDLASPWAMTFRSPSPDHLAYVGRNHPLIEAMAEHLLDLAFHPNGDVQPVARCGAIRTDQVTRRTAIFLLRLRYLQHGTSGDGGTPALAEETVAWGVRGFYPDVTVLDLAEAGALLDAARATGSVPGPEKREVLAETLGWWPKLAGALDDLFRLLRVTQITQHGSQGIEAQGWIPRALGEGIGLRCRKQKQDEQQRQQQGQSNSGKGHAVLHSLPPTRV